MRLCSHGGWGKTPEAAPSVRGVSTAPPLALRPLRATSGYRRVFSITFSQFRTLGNHISELIPPLPLPSFPLVSFAATSGALAQLAPSFADMLFAVDGPVVCYSEPVAKVLALLRMAQEMSRHSLQAHAAWRPHVRMYAKALEALSESHATSSVWAPAGIAALVRLCQDPDAAAAAATALSNLSIFWHLSSLSEQEHAANRAAIIGAGAIPSLVALLGDGTESKAGGKAAAVLHDLAQDAEGRADIIAAGAIPPLVALLSGGPESIAAHWAAGTLSWLAYKSEASRNPMVVAGAIPLLVALLRGGPESGAAAAAAVVLSALRVYHTDVLEELARTQTSCSPWDRLRECMCRTASGRLE